MRIMRIGSLLAAALACALAATACAAEPVAEVAESSGERVAFTKVIMVLDVPVYATNTTSDEKLRHADRGCDGQSAGRTVRVAS